MQRRNLPIERFSGAFTNRILVRRIMAPSLTHAASINSVFENAIIRLANQKANGS
jgi:hypothetical protein